MTRSHPPRLALYLLRRFLGHDEALVGDLIEGFARNGSRVWIWRQTLAALATDARRPRDEDHPLGLADPFDHAAPQRAVTTPRTVNLTASPLPGIGGLGLVAFGVLVAVVNPAVAWIFLPAIVGGVALGIVMVIRRRRSIT
jgi:hypothetical protein